MEHCLHAASEEDAPLDQSLNGKTTNQMPFKVVCTTFVLYRQLNYLGIKYKFEKNYSFPCKNFSQHLNNFQ